MNFDKMIIWYKLAIYCLIVSKSQENAVSSDLLKEFIFKYATKHWFAYVRSFLLKNIKRQYDILGIESPSQKSCLRLCSQNIQSLLYSSKRLAESFSLKSSLVLHKLFDFELSFGIFPHLFYKYETTLPIMTLRPHGYHPFGQITEWRFTLTKYLRMNLTVEYLLIHPSNLIRCLSHLGVYDKNKRLKYCGRHSQIIFYSLGQKPAGNLVIHLFVTYDILIRYMVIDSIPSIQLWTDKKFYSMKSQIYPMILLKNTLLHQFDNTVVSFHIQVSKLEIIILHVKSVQDVSEIYDGPGVFSPILKHFQLNTFRTVYRSTTFQILLFHQNENKTSTTHDFNITSNKCLNKTMLKLRTMEPGTFTTIIYPQQKLCGFETVCVLRIETSYELHIKIKTKGFIYKGHNSSSCSFGGFAVYDYIHEEYREERPICTTQDNSNIHRNMYSSSNELMMVFYLFKQYIDLLFMSFLVSTTKCQIIIRNVCEFSKTYLTFEHLSDKNFNRSTEIAINYDAFNKTCQIIQLLKMDMKTQDCSMNVLSMLKTTAEMSITVHLNVTVLKNISKITKLQVCKIYTNIANQQCVVKLTNSLLNGRANEHPQLVDATSVIKHTYSIVKLSCWLN